MSLSAVITSQVDLYHPVHHANSAIYVLFIAIAAVLFIGIIAGAAHFARRREDRAAGNLEPGTSPSSPGAA